MGRSVGASVRLIARDPRFDSRFYLAAYPDVDRSGAHPAAHYVRRGAFEGRAPAAEFDGFRYASTNPEVDLSGMSPLEHFIREGYRAGRPATPLVVSPLADHGVVPLDVLGRALRRSPAVARGALLRSLAPRLRGILDDRGSDELADVIASKPSVRRLRSQVRRAARFADGSGPAVAIGPGPEADVLVTVLGVLAQEPGATFALATGSAARLPGILRPPGRVETAGVLELDAGLWPVPGAVAALVGHGALPGTAVGVSLAHDGTALVGVDRWRYSAGGAAAGSLVTKAFALDLSGRATGADVAPHDDRPRALVVAEAIPTPDLDSGSLSSLNYMRALQRLGYRVSFLPRDLVRLERYAAELEVEGIEVWTRPAVDSIEQVLDTAGPFDLAFVLRPMVFAAVAPYVRFRSPGATVVYVPTDLHHLRMSAQARIQDDATLAMLATGMERVELDNVRSADLTLVISETEHQLLRRLAPDARVELVPMARESPGGSRDPAGREIMFLGGFGHAPNVDAVDWFLDEVWPLIADELPDAEFAVYGAALPSELLGRSADRIHMRGYVPELSEAFANARVMVVPLRFGAGIKGKIVTAMHSGVPIVSTQVGVDGMSLDGEVHVANSPADFAAAVIELYRSPSAARELAGRASRTAEGRFTLTQLVTTLERILGGGSREAQPHRRAASGAAGRMDADH